MPTVKYYLVPGYLKLAGYTLDKAAERLQITRRTLDNKINGVTDFTLTEAREVKIMCGRPMDDIFLTNDVA